MQTNGGFVGPNEDSEWVVAHRALSRLAKERAHADAEEGRWLLAALRAATHAHLGFGSFGEYVERLFGYGRRWTQERLRVAEALEGLPATVSALESGAISWSSARELTRVAVVETEVEWLEAARDKTVHALEALVACKNPGDRPASANRRPRRHVLRFEVSPETFALFREAMHRLRRDTGHVLEDDAALLSMARAVLGGPADAGRASYQIALSVCPECSAGFQQASGELVSVDRAVVAMAECDGQHVGSIDAGAGAENDAHTGAKPRSSSTRAKQTVPPALRRAVLRRDRHACVVPGCRQAVFVDVHRRTPRSEGGTNDAENLVTLCGAHHRALHQGKLAIPVESAEVRFTHADGSRYGSSVRPLAAEARAKAFAALRGLGFAEGNVRRALDSVPSANDESTEAVLRAALVRLSAPSHVA